MIVKETQKSVKVTLFLKALGPVFRVPIETARIAYDDARSGKTCVLLVHQSLYFEDIDHKIL
jgi:hypothetical protein